MTEILALLRGPGYSFGTNCDGIRDGGPMRVTCKFRVDSVEHTEWSERVNLSAVHGGTAENESFAEATPFGKLEIQVDNPAVKGAFKPGQEYYVDLTPVYGAGQAE